MLAASRECVRAGVGEISLEQMNRIKPYNLGVHRRKGGGNNKYLLSVSLLVSYTFTTKKWLYENTN